LLALIAAGWSVAHASKRIGIKRRSVYDLKERDQDFAQALEEARELSKNELEMECRRRAQGWTETRYTKDGEPYEVFNYSDNLLMFMLKKLDPSYREQATLNIKEERRILIDLLPVEKGPDGRLRIAENNEVPLLDAEFEEIE